LIAAELSFLAVFVSYRRFTHSLEKRRSGRTRSDYRPGANYHFEDQILNGKMSFDYRLQPRVVQKSNALELMRSDWM